ncbi:MAG TPA: hypothetical protein VNU68_14245 [Verrucomicrobiae bacterium]|nr:hypothetical protein [Verrucomicrobiae bacterium]
MLIQGGAGSGALAEAIVANGEVTGIRILDPGSGYTSLPSGLPDQMHPSGICADNNN